MIEAAENADRRSAERAEDMLKAGKTPKTNLLQRPSPDKLRYQHAKVAKEQASLAILKANMSAWQAAERRSGRERTVPNNFMSSLLGAPPGAAGLQGAESNSVVAFLVGSELPRLYRDGKLAGARWHPRRCRAR